MPAVPATASLAGIPFRLNPTSIAWDYQVKVSETPTIGGRVVQIYGTQLGDMTVEGSFGVGGWEEQRGMLERMKIVAAQQGVQPVGVQPSPPMRFLVPTHGYDFQVMLKAFTQVDANNSVMWDNRIIAPSWMLTFFIVENNIGLKKVATDQFLARLAQGLGWSLQPGWSDVNVFNGPLTETASGQAYAAALVQGLNQANGVGTPTSNSPSATSSTALSGNSNAQKVFNYFTSKGLAPFQAAAIVGNFMQESSCDPEKHQLGGGPGRGLAQWEVGGRWNPALETGNADADLAAQLDFAWQEMNGSHSSSLSALQASTDVQSATQVFEKYYEGAGTPDISNRIAFAQSALASFGSGH